MTEEKELAVNIDECQKIKIIGHPTLRLSIDGQVYNMEYIILYTYVPLNKTKYRKIENLKNSFILYTDDDKKNVTIIKQSDIILIEFKKV